MQPRRLDAPATPDLAGMDLQQILQALEAQSRGGGSLSGMADEGNGLAREQALQMLTQRRLPIDPATAFNGGVAGI